MASHAPEMYSVFAWPQVVAQTFLLVAGDWAPDEHELMMSNESLAQITYFAFRVLVCILLLKMATVTSHYSDSHHTW